MTDDPARRLGDIELTFDASCDDAVSVALEMLAYNLSRLGAKERYARLEEIIEDGALLSQVKGFVAARMMSPSYPQAKQTNGAAT